jgi:hypothetical protein
MRSIICVANKSDPIRLGYFLNSLTITMKGKHHLEDLCGNENNRVIIINTGLENQWINHMKDSYSRYNFIDLGIDRSVTAAEQMKLRMEALSSVCNDDDMLCNFDDDYQFNPHWLNFADFIMSENPGIQYLTLLKMIMGNGMVYPGWAMEPFKLSGFNFSRVKSALGGSFITRWGIYKDHMERFFNEYKGDEYDGPFWDVVDAALGMSHNIYMSYDFSLFQHCNMISQYGHHNPHSYATDYDPIVNPWSILPYIV